MAYIFVRMANSPRPALMVLEKSTDYGKTYKVWQYFAGAESDCEKRWGLVPNGPIYDDDTIICSTKFSGVLQLEGGEVCFSSSCALAVCGSFVR